jgi:hypothetical protein
MTRFRIPLHVQWALSEELAEQRTGAKLAQRDVARAGGLPADAIDAAERADSPQITPDVLAAYALCVPARVEAMLELLPRGARPVAIDALVASGVAVGPLGPDRLPLTGSTGRRLGDRLRAERVVRDVDLKEVGAAAVCAGSPVEVLRAVRTFDAGRDPRPAAAIVGAYFHRLGFDPADAGLAFNDPSVEQAIADAAGRSRTSLAPNDFSFRRDLAAELRGALHRAGLSRREVLEQAEIPTRLYELLQTRDFSGPVTNQAIGRLAAIGAGVDLARCDWSSDWALGEAHDARLAWLARRSGVARMQPFMDWAEFGRPARIAPGPSAARAGLGIG